MASDTRWAVVKKETNISHSYHDTKREAEKVAREMTGYHQQQYIVREVPKAIRDALGRPVRPVEEPDPPRKTTLSDDEITAIAHEVRTKPLSEVGRHVMPLIQHIVATEAAACHTCRHWVAYNQGAETASRGECLVYAAPGSPVKFSGETPAALLTPFDWSCKGWAEKPRETIDAQAQCSI